MLKGRADLGRVRFWFAFFAWGEYRTKRVILALYDAMTYAIETGTAYQTRLNPPPASASAAHVLEIETKR